MTVSLKYTGAQTRYFETAVTGKPTAWRPGAIADVGDADAALLLATGVFARAYADGQSDDGIPPELTTANVTAVQAAHAAGVLGLTAGQVSSLSSVAGAYSDQPTVWYPGDVLSTPAPNNTASGDLATATKQVPAYWRICADPDNQIEAAGRLMSGANLWDTVICGGPVAQHELVDLAGVRKTFTRAYAICVSASGLPANYTGGVALVNAADTNISNWVTHMIEFSWSGALNATHLRAVASGVFTNYFSALSLSAGKVL